MILHLQKIHMERLLVCRHLMVRTVFLQTRWTERLFIEDIKTTSLLQPEMLSETNILEHMVRHWMVIRVLVHVMVHHVTGMTFTHTEHIHNSSAIQLTRNTT